MDFLNERQNLVYMSRIFKSMIILSMYTQCISDTAFSVETSRYLNHRFCSFFFRDILKTQLIPLLPVTVVQLQMLHPDLQLGEIR